MYIYIYIRTHARTNMNACILSGEMLSEVMAMREASTGGAAQAEDTHMCAYMYTRK